MHVAANFAKNKNIWPSKSLPGAAHCLVVPCVVADLINEAWLDPSQVRTSFQVVL